MRFRVTFWVFFLSEQSFPEDPRVDLGPRPLKVSKQNYLGATILGIPPQSGTPFWTPFLDPILDHILDPIFGSQFGTHFGKWPPEGPGPIWAPGHLKCQSKTVLERPFWGAPQIRDPILDPIFGLLFGPRFWTPFLDPIVGHHF